jgi:hypothetical protein
MVVQKPVHLLKITLPSGILRNYNAYLWQIGAMHGAEIEFIFLSEDEIANEFRGVTG